MSTASSTTAYELGEPLFLLVLTKNGQVTAKPYITEQGMQAGITSIERDFTYRRIGRSGVGPDSYQAYRLHGYKTDLISSGSAEPSDDGGPT